MLSWYLAKAIRDKFEALDGGRANEDGQTALAGFNPLSWQASEDEVYTIPQANLTSQFTMKEKK